MAFDSLYTGISGLDAYQSWIDMISNNIANTATVGFKAQRMTFADQFYQQIGSPTGPTTTNGGVNPLDQGLGVKVNTIDTEFGQGGLETTGINTDLALNGNGFFILNNANGTGTPTYTRDGAFSLNSNGLFYNPADGLAVMGYMANADGVVTPTGTPGAITIPIGLQEQAQATGTGTKVGPATNDDVFDVALGGNLDQTNWSQAFQQAVGASANPGAPVTVSTTFYDSLGNSHEATITYTPIAPSAVAASVTNAGATPGLLTSYTVAPATSVADTVTVTAEGAAGFTIADKDSGSTQTAQSGSTITVGGVTMTLGTAATGDQDTLDVVAAQNGLPGTVENAAGVAVQPATEWQVSVSFADGTQFDTITKGAVVAANGTVQAASVGVGSSGVVGYVYFDQNGQYINTSSIESVAAGEDIGANAAGYFHDAGATADMNQGNQLDVTQWGPSVGNAAQAPTGVATPGAIALGLYDGTSLEGDSTATVVSQNGYSAGTLSNITVGTDGVVTGSFTNGQSKTLAQLAIASFQNEDGLERIGGNQFAQTAASGLAQIGTADSGQYGSIVAGSLEESNVNLANEFTNLIVAQRAFQANSRGIETADANLQTVIALQASQN
ncbi:MAG TPA: flagellar hook-basal body complex protein [Candidatus Acidoferrales bacterium]|nr:flagellar hook-basal body complex protein [Candidatus Acidoferrales bacterium]HTX57793.1 flagellar hook-basal body complex protein [Candidatus Acidoferrales bacterium]